MEALGGLLAGLLAGTFGVGGGAITIPFLVFLVGLSLPSAIATNLIIVAFNSALSMTVHVRQGTVNWDGVYMGVTGAFTTVFGNYLFTLASERGVLNYVVGSVFMTLALVLLKIGDGNREPAIVHLLVTGSFMGVYSALVGKGGGSLALPLLVALFKVKTKEAIKVNVVATPLVATSAALEKLSMNLIRFNVAMKFIPFMLLGSYIGARTMRISSSERLKLMYSSFLFAVGFLFILLHSL